jgi:hypothetical protein
VADWTQVCGGHLRIEPDGPHRLEARHGEAWRRRQEDEIASLEGEGTLPVHGSACRGSVGSWRHPVLSLELLRMTLMPLGAGYRPDRTTLIRFREEYGDRLHRKPSRQPSSPPSTIAIDIDRRGVRAPQGEAERRPRVVVHGA